MKTPHIRDMFSDLVTATSVKLINQLQQAKTDIVRINFLCDRPQGIIKDLQQMSQSEISGPQRFPLIALFQPYDETKGSLNGIAEVTNIRMIIAGLSNSEWKAPDRYQNNFYPILYPIYDEFFNQMELDQRFFTTDSTNISHVKRDWPFWDDNQDKNPFNDVLDIIEITNLKININLSYC